MFGHSGSDGTECIFTNSFFEEIGLALHSAIISIASKGLATELSGY